MLIVVLLAGLSVAGYCLTILVSPGTERRERGIFAFPAGAAAYTLAIFCINQGFGALLTRPLLLAVLAALCAVAGAGAALRRLPAAGPPTPGEPAEPHSGFAAVELVLLAVLLAILAAAGTLAPMEHWDVNSEYYPIEREIFLHKTLPLGVTPSSAEATRAFPPGYTTLVACGDILAGGMRYSWARALSPLFALVLLMTLYRMGRRHLALSREAALAGVLFCAALPIFSTYMTVPTSTISFACYSLISLYYFLEYYREPGQGPLALAGLFLGFSYWTSYTGVVLIPCVLLTAVVCAAAGRFSRRDGLSALRIPFPRLVGLILIIGAVAAPHLARNWIRFGNPLYPALYQVFGGVWIDDWSIRHLIVPLMPSTGFYLRPRWEIFHEGFLIQLLFVLSLLSWPWYRKPQSLFLALFCIFYTGFYLKFFTWPREYGISIKLLLPSLIPACLFAGERLSRIIGRSIPRWQSAAVLLLVPLWAAFMLRDEVLYLAVRQTARWSRFPDWIQLASALCVDLDEMLVWAGVALCLVTAFPRRLISAGTAASALLLAGLACRPLSEGALALAVHAYTAAHDRSYSFWNAAISPGYLPESRWLDRNLPPDAVITAFDSRTFMFPRRVIPLDTPALWPLYRGLDIDGCIALLRREGITHLCLADFVTRIHPLYGKSPIFAHMGDPAFLPLIYPGAPRQEPGHELKVYAVGGRGAGAPEGGGR
ncbi:MAG: glycosyltransferase family 39 protein [Chlamydiota bacterium]